MKRYVSVFFGILLICILVPIRQMQVKAEDIPYTYDSTEQGVITSHKKQNAPVCWSYAGTNAAESSLLKRNVSADKI